MSILSLISVYPRVRIVSGTLVATTEPAVWLLTLGALYHKVVVDPQSQEVDVYRRHWWVGNRRKIPFHAITGVTYGYQEWRGPLYSRYSWEAYSETDVYSIGLELHDDEHVHLFYFYGDTSWTGEGERSKRFVEELSSMIGVHIVPARR